MSNSFNRRDVLKYAGVAAAGMLASPLARWAGAQAEGKTKKVLFFSKSGTFEHPCITRKQRGQLSFAENLMVNFGKQHGFEVTCSKDGRIFTPEKIAEFDVLMFCTQGNPLQVGRDREPAMTPEGKDAFLKAIAEGKGFLGVHCASDTFHSPKNGPLDPYIEMLGGEFVVHHSQQDAKIESADPDWPPTKGLETFTKKEEWYILNHFAPDLHVLLVQDTQSMREEQYRRLKPYPETWARHHHEGRVFFSSMGHREDVWESEQFQKVLLGGLNWVARNIDAEVKPNIEQVTPGIIDEIRKPTAA